MAGPRKTCPWCGSRNVAAILWGYPARMADLEDDLDSGRLVLGGCCVPEKPATQTCRDCGHHWSRGWGRTRTEGLILTADGGGAAGGPGPRR